MFYARSIGFWYVACQMERPHSSMESAPCQKAIKKPVAIKSMDLALQLVHMNPKALGDK
jgi:hypothetical protein